MNFLNSSFLFWKSKLWKNLNKFFLLKVRDVLSFIWGSNLNKINNISNNCNSKLIFSVELFSIKARYKFWYFIILINNSLRKGKIPFFIKSNKSEFISILFIFLKYYQIQKLFVLKNLLLLHLRKLILHSHFSLYIFHPKK